MYFNLKNGSTFVSHSQLIVSDNDKGEIHADSSRASWRIHSRSGQRQHQDNAKQKHASSSLSYSWSPVDGRCIQHAPSSNRGGMTVALSDIVVLRNLLRPLRDLNDAPSLCKYLESFYTLCKVMCSQATSSLCYLFFPLWTIKMNKTIIKPRRSACYLNYLNLSICSLWHPQ